MSKHSAKDRNISVHPDKSGISQFRSAHGDTLFPPAPVSTAAIWKCYTAVIVESPMYIIPGISFASLLCRALFPESIFIFFPLCFILLL